MRGLCSPDDITHAFFLSKGRPFSVLTVQKGTQPGDWKYTDSSDAGREEVARE